MSARDSAYLVPVGLRGENKKAPWREEASERKEEDKDSFRESLA